MATHHKQLLLVLADTSLINQFRLAFDGFDVSAQLTAEANFLQHRASLMAGLDLLVFLVGGANLDRCQRFLDEAAQPAACPLLIVGESRYFAALNPPAGRSVDYLRLPFDLAECRLRLRRLLWPDEGAAAASTLRAGELVLDTNGYEAKVGERALELTYLEYSLLAFLVSHPGRTYSREALLRQVWGIDYFGGDRTVDVHVRRIRAKLGSEMAAHLKTIRNVGYIWKM